MNPCSYQETMNDLWLYQEMMLASDNDKNNDNILFDHILQVNNIPVRYS